MSEKEFDKELDKLRTKYEEILQRPVEKIKIDATSSPTLSKFNIQLDLDTLIDE